MCDFGVSKKVKKGQILRDHCGTPAYIAPEILREEGYTGEPADIWSAGVALYTMLYGIFPFKANSVSELDDMILRCEYSLPYEISDNARDLLSRILVSDPDLRITLPKIYSHPWMSFIDEEGTSIFTKEEMAAIRMEYDFKQKPVDESINSENDSSIFTEHNLDITENSNDISKSVILAPFNSIEKNHEQFKQNIKKAIKRKQIIKLNPKLREIDRGYERDNNSQVDNGIYVKQIAEAHQLISNKVPGTVHKDQTFSCKSTTSSYQAVGNCFLI